MSVYLPIKYLIFGNEFWACENYYGRIDCYCSSEEDARAKCDALNYAPDPPAVPLTNDSNYGTV